jgi:hypothetical protein
MVVACVDPALRAGPDRLAHNRDNLVMTDPAAHGDVAFLRVLPLEAVPRVKLEPNPQSLAAWASTPKIDRRANLKLAGAC